MRSSWMGWTVILGCAGLMAAPATAAAEGPIKNGLSAEAFRHNALTTNAGALQILMSHALDDPQLFAANGNLVERQLADPRARAVLTEIVRCALGPGATVTHGVTWTGEVGLCQPDASLGSLGPDAPSWGPSGPNVACQQLVTACLAARVNALNRSIPLALHGEPGPLFPPRDPVSTETAFRESVSGADPSVGMPIGSFSGPGCAPGVECNWAQAFVGRCDPAGGPVRLAIQDALVCGTTPVRVCGGIHGCYTAASGYSLPQDALDLQNPQQASYWGMWKDQVGACAGAGPKLEFSCPTGFAGYYSVMTRPITPPGDPPQPGTPAMVQVVGTGTYPAKSADVFTFREGAFYGNLFAPGELAWSCEMTDATTRTCTPVNGNQGKPEVCSIRGQVTGVAAPCEHDPSLPYRNVYACYALADKSDGQGNGSDDAGAAYLSDRICADPSHTCFFHRPVRCNYADPDANQQLGAHCQWNGDGAYHRCESADRSTRYLTITTYLNGTCDLLRDPQTCDATRKAVASGPAPTPVVHRRGCGACSGGFDGGGLVPGAVLAIAAALGRARRRVQRARRG